MDVLVGGEEGAGNSAALGAGCAGYEKGLGLGLGHDSFLV
jgi:hypothetical protein